METIQSRKNSDLAPNYTAPSVREINFEVLKAVGVSALAVDLDGTLTHHLENEINPALIEHLHTSKLPIIIATNRLEGVDQSIIAALQPIHTQHASSTSRKPNQSYYTAIEEATNIAPENICMIGDRLLTDIAGANKAGWQTVWVSPIGRDPWYTRVFMLRQIERVIAKRVTK